MNKKTVTYTERRTYQKYDEGRIIGYLNEEVVPNYVPDNNSSEDGGQPEPTVGYRYTGTEPDGGTVMPCSDPQDYGQLANAIIRSTISESEELAIQRHYHNDPVAYGQEWARYNETCENAKAQAKMWMGIE